MVAVEPSTREAHGNHSTPTDIAMADQATQEPHDEAPAKKGPGVMTLVKAVAIVSVVVLAQVGGAAMLLPSAEETQEVGKQLAGAGHGAEHGDAHGNAHGEHTKEVNLGAYHIVSFNHKTGASLSVDFELFGTVLESEAQEFDHLYMAHEKRISEQITIAVRGMQVADLSDPGLGLIKRIILEKTNRALGKPLLREAVINQFSFIPR
jgi:hypothetical protein